MSKPVVLLKISGESLTENGHKGLLCGPVAFIIRQIQAAQQAGYRIAVVVGGGNFGRGSEIVRGLNLKGSQRVDADWMGMLFTYANGIMLKSEMREKFGMKVRLMLARPFGEVGEPFLKDKAVRHLDKGNVIILAGGTGNPGCSTDSAAVLRAFEIGADIVLKGTKVDRVYSRDPNDDQHPEPAFPFPYISYSDFLARDLKILDATAVSDARAKNLPIRVFNIFKPGSLLSVLTGEGVYSEIGPAETLFESSQSHDQDMVPDPFDCAESNASFGEKGE